MKVYTLGDNPGGGAVSGRYVKQSSEVSGLTGTVAGGQPLEACPGQRSGQDDPASFKKHANLGIPRGVTLDGAGDPPGITSCEETSSGSDQSYPDDGSEGSPHSCKVDGVSYKVKVRVGSWWRGACCRPKEDKVILQNISIHLKSGQLSGLLGNSGSGKTSLLDVISSRHSGEVEGAVYLDNVRLTESVFRRTASYVIQADRLLAHLTVKESLLYTAKLKFAAQLSKADLKSKVDTIMREMGLSHVANSPIGGAFTRGISGGERRRVSVAVQLLQDPYLLLLDEPTTGLDSFTAHYLVDTLATLARRRNKIILLSIHQPRSDIFKLFDNIGLLTQGKMVYFGPRDQMVPYFSRLGHPCPTYANPLDFYVDVASIDRRTEAEQGQTTARVDSLCSAYVDSDIYRLIAKEAAITEGQVSGAADTRDKLGQQGVPRSDCLEKTARFFVITGILLSRMYLNIWKDRSAFFSRIFVIVSIGAFLWIFCWKLPMTFLTGIQDRTGVFYQSTSAVCMAGVLNAASLFPVLRDLYYREAREGLYNSVHFLMAYYLHILPFHLVSSMIFSVWIYWGIGLYPVVSRFWIFYATVVAQQHLGEIQTLICLALANDPALAQSVSTLLGAASCLYACGLFRAFHNMIPPLVWFSYINFFRYSTELVVANEYHMLNMSCPGVGSDCYVMGDVYLDEFFPGAVDNMARNFGILAAFVVGFWIITIAIFRIRGIRQLY